MDGVQASMGRMWLVPVLLLMRVCGAEAAEACNCTPRSATCGPPGDFWRATAVFAGRVMAVERATNRLFLKERRARLRVLERFRGPVPATGGEVDVLAGTIGLCGYPFKVGQEYFVYAVRQEDGRLTTSTCSRTSLLQRSDLDLGYARAAAAGTAPAGRIVGSVRHAEASAGRKPIGGVPVLVTREGKTVTSTTDARGQYAIEVQATGSYVVHVQLPETQYTLHSGRSVEVPDPRACIESNVDVFFNGRVAGQVLDSTGKGVPGLTVLLASSGRAETAVRERSRTLTRDDGHYELDRVAPGALMLSVELPAEEHDDSSDVTPVERGPLRVSRVARLGPGERLSVAPLVLPPAVRIVPLEGSVHTVDGAPAPGARVFLKSSGERSHILGAPAVADALGRFRISALEGEHYWVFSERPVAAGRASEFSEPVMISAAPRMSPLRLTVRRRF